MKSKVVNKKAYFNFKIVEDYISGIVLSGSEVKSLRNNNFNFGDSFVIFKNGELFIRNMNISKYKDATYQNHEELRERKLLLTKKEISKISKLSEVKGTTIVPLEIFLLRGKFKIKIGVCTGKKDYDKRNILKLKDIEREERRKF